MLAEERGDIFVLRIVDVYNEGRLGIRFIVCDADGCYVIAWDVELVKYSAG